MTRWRGGLAARGGGAGRWCYGRGRAVTRTRNSSCIGWRERARRLVIWWYGHGWLSWFGQRVPAIADELRRSPKTVRRWLHRFNRLGLDGLEDLGGQGRRRRICEAERSRITGLVQESAPGRLTVQAGGDRAAADEAGPLKWTLDALSAEARHLSPGRPAARTGGVGAGHPCPVPAAQRASRAPGSSDASGPPEYVCQSPPAARDTSTESPRIAVRIRPVRARRRAPGATHPKAHGN
ncbi:helix-turn-helix domain-containing protein [Streptomyces sp. NPDC018045]|uniref:helix-turn-helix domain-containing protein n=1 Tax=Streptomyces sp. NPDC018045 TaxID=3365037 RepID=UPI00378B4BCB